MGSSQIDRDETPPARAPQRFALGQPPVFEGVGWTPGKTFDRADPPVILLDFAVDHLKARGLAPVGEVILVRHMAGGRGLPATAKGAGYGFTIDLTDARRTLDGGLLLFADGTDRVSGWRAERGALTLWSGEDPELTELAPGAPERLTLVGRAIRA